MATVYVYNNYLNAVEKYERDLSEPMPYILNGSMTVDEFRGSSCSRIFWTDRKAMEAWNILRNYYGSPIPLGYAFKRPWEGGHGQQSQHYAGVSFDMGQTLSAAQRNNLREAAINSNAWSYVEPAYLTPTWVHADKRAGPPACSAGYPLLREGAKGVYVFILQDLLNALGYSTGSLDGIYGPRTRYALIDFQRANGLNPDAIVGCATWQTLTEQGVGIGQTGSVIGKC